MENLGDEIMTNKELAEEVEKLRHQVECTSAGHELRVQVGYRSCKFICPNCGIEYEKEKNHMTIFLKETYTNLTLEEKRAMRYARKFLK